MKQFVMGLLVMALGNSICWAVEIAPRITDREIVERLTRIEEGQKSILREMDKRFESMDKRFDQLINIIIAIIIAFAGMVAVTIGFAIWDRRTMIRPFEIKVKAMESQIDEVKIKVRDFDEDKLLRLIGAMRKFAESNKDIADALRSFNLL